MELKKKQSCTHFTFKTKTWMNSYLPPAELFIFGYVALAAYYNVSGISRGTALL